MVKNLGEEILKLRSYGITSQRCKFVLRVEARIGTMVISGLT